MGFAVVPEECKKPWFLSVFCLGNNSDPVPDEYGAMVCGSFQSKSIGIMGC